jgi:hypothetical protein
MSVFVYRRWPIFMISKGTRDIGCQRSRAIVRFSTVVGCNGHILLCRKIGPCEQINFMSCWVSESEGWTAFYKIASTAKKANRSCPYIVRLKILCTWNIWQNFIEVNLVVFETSSDWSTLSTELQSILFCEHRYWTAVFTGPNCSDIQLIGHNIYVTTRVFQGIGHYFELRFYYKPIRLKKQTKTSFSGWRVVDVSTTILSHLTPRLAVELNWFRIIVVSCRLVRLQTGLRISWLSTHCMDLQNCYWLFENLVTFPLFSYSLSAIGKTGNMKTLLPLHQVHSRGMN